MRRPVRICLGSSLVLVLVFALSCGACRSMPYLRLAADEEPYALWMAALKGFEGPVYYLGGDETYSYFRAGTIFYTPYEARKEDPFAADFSGRTRSAVPGNARDGSPV